MVMGLMSLIELLGGAWAGPKWFPIWSIWLIIGCIGGYWYGRLSSVSIRYTILSIVVGVIGGMVAGWGYVALSGGGECNEYISMLTSMAGCALLLWLLNMLMRKRNSGGNGV